MKKEKLMSLLKNVSSDREAINIILNNHILKSSKQFDQLAEILILWKNTPIATKNKMTLSGLLSRIKKESQIDLRVDLSRNQPAVNARVIFCFIAAKNGFKLQEIGDEIGRKHSSVHGAVKKFSDFYQTDREFKELYNKIMNLI